MTHACMGTSEPVSRLQVTPDAMAANPLQAQPSAEREVAAIIAFAARYYSGLPFEVRSCKLRGSCATSFTKAYVQLNCTTSRRS